MAVSKDKVLAAIEEKFKGSSLTKHYKETIAKKLADKIETDADIDSYIDDRADFFTETQAEADRRVSSVVKPSKVEDTPKNEEPKVDNDEMPSYLKALMETIEGLKSEFNTMKSQKVTDSIADRFSKDERLAGIDPRFYKGRVPTSETDFESSVLGIASDFKAFADENKLSVLGRDAPSRTSAGGGSNTKLASQAEIDAAFSKI